MKITPRLQWLSLVLGLAVTGVAQAGTTLPTAMAGQYILSAQSGEGSFQCLRTIDVTVRADQVHVRNHYSEDTFETKDAGCIGHEEHDISLGTKRWTCTSFSENNVKESSTLPLTVVGFVREFKGLRMEGPNTLIYQHDNTQVPLGAIGAWDNEKFKCTYERVTE